MVTEPRVELVAYEVSRLPADHLDAYSFMLRVQRRSVNPDGIRQLLSPPHRKKAAALMLGAHRRPVEFAGWGAFVVDGATPAAGGPLARAQSVPPAPGRHRPQRCRTSASTSSPVCMCRPARLLHVPSIGQRREQPTPHQRHDRGDTGLDEPVPCRGVPEQVGIPEQFGGGRLLGTEVENFRRDIHSRHIAKIIGAQTHYSLVGSHYSSVGAQARRRRALRSTTSASGPSGSGSCLGASAARCAKTSCCSASLTCWYSSVVEALLCPIA